MVPLSIVKTDCDGHLVHHTCRLVAVLPYYSGLCFYYQINLMNEI